MDLSLYEPFYKNIVVFIFTLINNWLSEYYHIMKGQYFSVGKESYESNLIRAKLWLCNTTVYHKCTFSGVYSNFNGFVTDECKHGLIFTLLFRIISIVFDFSKFDEEVSYLKNVLQENSFPSN